MNRERRRKVCWAFVALSAIAVFLAVVSTVKRSHAKRSSKQPAAQGQDANAVSKDMQQKQGDVRSEPPTQANNGPVTQASTLTDGSAASGAAGTTSSDFGNPLSNNTPVVAIDPEAEAEKAPPAAAGAGVTSLTAAATSGGGSGGSTNSNSGGVGVWGQAPAGIGGGGQGGPAVVTGAGNPSLPAWERSGNTTDPLAALLGTQGLGRAFDSLKGHWFAAAKTCNPKTGAEFVAAFADPNCQVINLEAGVAYITGNKEIVVDRPVVVIGNPINRPLIDGTEAERVFRITSTGYLEVSYTRFYRGHGILVGGFQIVLRGSGALVEPGGGISFRGVDFTTPISFQPTFRSISLFGGTILMLGGTVQLTNCRFWAVTPTGVRVAAAIGGEVYIQAGVFTATGCTFLSQVLIAANAGAGLLVFIGGGVAVLTGCQFIRILGVSVSGIVGASVFVGGGVAVLTGCTLLIQGVLFSYWGASILAFTGGGVTINTGFTAVFNLLFSASAGVGAYGYVGGGIQIWVGALLNTQIIFQFAAFAGGTAFTGAGYLLMLGAALIREAVGLSIWNVGGFAGVGAGELDVVGSPLVAIQVFSAAAQLGFVLFCGVGKLFLAASPTIRISYYFFTAGQGSVAYLGSGTLRVIDEPGLTLAYVGWVQPTVAKYYANGLVSPNGTLWVPLPDFDYGLEPANRRLQLPPPQKRPSLPGLTRRGEASRWGKRVLTATATADGGPFDVRASANRPVVGRGSERVLTESEEGEVRPTSIVIKKSNGVDMSHVPEGMREVFDDLNLRPVEDQFLYVGKGVTDCDVCNSAGSTPTGDIHGPTADMCTVRPACGAPADTATTGETGNAGASPDRTDNAAWNEFFDTGRLPTTYLTTVTLKLGCTSEDKCGDDKAVKAAFSSYLQSVVNGTQTFKVAAARMDLVEPLLADLMPAEAVRRAQGTEDCPSVHEYQVYMTMHVKDEHTTVQSALQQLSDDAGTSIQALVEELRAMSEAVCSATVQPGFNMEVPGIQAKKPGENADPLYDDPAAAAFTSSFTSDMGVAPYVKIHTAKKSKPLEQVQIGKQYKVDIENLPSLSTVTLNAVSTNGGPSVNIGSGMVPQGASSLVMDWAVSKGSYSKGQYYIEAAYGSQPHQRALSDAIKVING